MSYTVYKHTSPSGKVYIGITSQEPESRWGPEGVRYKYNIHFYAAIKKYGWSAFRHEILADGLPKEVAEAMEVRLIAEHDSTDPTKGYNRSTGGEKSGAGAKHTDEAKAKISAANKGKHLGPETRRKLSESRKGWKPSAATRAKISEANRRRPGPNLGKSVKAETREKLRDAASKRPVVNLDTGQKFSSIHEAARAMDLHPSALCAVCNGKQKTHGGYRWAYGEGVAL